jgi:hypothetical protein
VNGINTGNNAGNTGPAATATLVNGANTAPPEHYVPGPAAYSDTAYHVHGALHTTYENQPSQGADNVINPQTDAVRQSFRTASYRDQLRIAKYDGLGTDASNTTVSSDASFASTKVSYAFWLNVQDATRNMGVAGYSSDDSYIIGRTGVQGGISIQENNNSLSDGTHFNLKLRSDPAPIGKTTFQFDPDTWNHFVVTYDLSHSATGVLDPLNNATIYINGGTSALLIEVFSNLGGRTLGNILRLGTNDLGTERGNYYFDDVGIWIGDVLTQQDAFLLYSQGLEAAVAAVPEPSSFGLAAMGLVSLALARRKRKA